MQLFRQVYVVVDDEGGTVLVAEGLYVDGGGSEFGFGGVFHAELYPAASAFEGDACGIHVGDGGREMRDELYVKHLMSEF